MRVRVLRVTIILSRDGTGLGQHSYGSGVTLTLPCNRMKQLWNIANHERCILPLAHWLDAIYDGQGLPRPTEANDHPTWSSPTAHPAFLILEGRSFFSLKIEKLRHSALFWLPESWFLFRVAFFFFSGALWALFTGCCDRRLPYSFPVPHVALLDAPDPSPCEILAHIHNTQEEKEGCVCRPNQPKCRYFSDHSSPRTNSEVPATHALPIRPQYSGYRMRSSRKFFFISPFFRR